MISALGLALCRRSSASTVCRALSGVPLPCMAFNEFSMIGSGYCPFAPLHLHGWGEIFLGRRQVRPYRASAAAGPALAIITSKWQANIGRENSESL